jgi:hypothetical protein
MRLSSLPITVLYAFELYYWVLSHLGSLERCLRSFTLNLHEEHEITAELSMALTHSRAQVRQMVSVQDFYKGILFEQARKALYSTRLAPLPKEFLGSTDGVCSEAPPHLTGEVFQLFWLVASDPAPRYLFRLSEQTWCPALSQSSTRSSSSSAKSSSCRSSCSP